MKETIFICTGSRYPTNSHKMSPYILHMNSTIDEVNNICYETLFINRLFQRISLNSVKVIINDNFMGLKLITSDVVHLLHPVRHVLKCQTTFFLNMKKQLTRI